jgi:hypothetical protein
LDQTNFQQERQALQALIIHVIFAVIQSKTRCKREQEPFGEDHFMLPQKVIVPATTRSIAMLIGKQKHQPRSTTTVVTLNQTKPEALPFQGNSK